LAQSLASKLSTELPTTSTARCARGGSTMSTVTGPSGRVRQQRDLVLGGRGGRAAARAPREQDRRRPAHDRGAHFVALQDGHERAEDLVVVRRILRAARPQRHLIRPPRVRRRHGGRPARTTQAAPRGSSSRAPARAGTSRAGRAGPRHERPRRVPAKRNRPARARG
jgi:hypothetical protein